MLLYTILNHIYFYAEKIFKIMLLLREKGSCLYDSVQTAFYKNHFPSQTLEKG